MLLLFIIIIYNIIYNNGGHYCHRLVGNATLFPWGGKAANPPWDGDAKAPKPCEEEPFDAPKAGCGWFEKPPSALEPGCGWMGNPAIWEGALEPPKPWEGKPPCWDEVWFAPKPCWLYPPGWVGAEVFISWMLPIWACRLDTWDPILGFETCKAQNEAY